MKSLSPSTAKRTITPPLLATAVLLAAITAGCSKESSQQTAPKTSAILNTPLLSKLPNSTAGFAVFDLSGDGYKNLQKSPWSRATGGISSLESSIAGMRDNGADESQILLAETALQALRKLGLVGADGTSTADKVISTSVVFVGPSTGDLPVEAGIFLSAAPSANMKEKLSVLKSVLSDAGLSVTEQQIAGQNGLRATPPDGEAGEAALFAAASEKELGITLSKVSLEGLFAPHPTTTLETLKGLPEFKKAENAVKSNEAPISFSFLSLPRMMPLLERAQDDEFNPKELPVESVALFVGYSQQYVQQIAAPLAPKSETQRKILSAFEGAALPASSLKLPRDAAFSLSLNTTVLSKLEEISRSIEASGIGSAALVKHIRGITLGARANNTGSPFPDLLLAVDTDKPEELSTSLEQLLSLGLMAAGQQAQWQSKEIAGNKARYFSTIIGIGVYMTAPKNSQTILIGTSEKALSDMVTTAADTSKAIEGGLSNTLKTRVPASSLGLFYVNFPLVANVIDTVKGSLGMFTGGSSEIDQAFDSAYVSSLGSSLGDISYTDGVLKLQSAFEATPK
jgi:hypothetical protein